MAGTVHYQIQNVTKRFQIRRSTIQALDPVSLDVYKNEFVAILGTSGCGKSTLLRMIAGFTAPTTGQILSNGQEITGPGPDRGMVFQAYTLFPWMTVRKNVEYGLRQQKIRKAERAEIAQKYLGVVELDGFADAYPKELSGGMKQRVAIARALAANPESLLLDEPFGALDAQTRAHMQELTLDVWRQYPKTIIMVTHDIEEAIFMADRIVVMRARPGSVKEIIDVDLPRDRDFHIKSDPAFLAYKRHINELIYEESLKVEQEELDA